MWYSLSKLGISLGLHIGAPSLKYGWFKASLAVILLLGSYVNNLSNKSKVYLSSFGSNYSIYSLIFFLCSYFGPNVPQYGKDVTPYQISSLGLPHFSYINWIYYASLLPLKIGFPIINSAIIHPIDHISTA